MKVDSLRDRLKDLSYYTQGERRLELLYGAAAILFVALASTQIDLVNFQIRFDILGTYFTGVIAAIGYLLWRKRSRLTAIERHLQPC
jgi:hypothetical protein